MALIKCPECGREKVSDSAIQCPECGFGIKEYFQNINHSTNNKSRNLILEGYVNNSYYRKNRVEVDISANAISILPPEERKHRFVSLNCPSLLAECITQNTAEEIAEYFKKFGCKVKIEKTSNPISQKQEEKIIDFLNKQNAPIRCPKCGSNSVSIGQRGFTITTGFIGSNKTVNRCGKCGYKWQP